MCYSELFALLVAHDFVLEALQGGDLCFDGAWVGQLLERRRNGGAAHGATEREYVKFGDGATAGGCAMQRRTASWTQDRHTIMPTASVTRAVATPVAKAGGLEKDVWVARVRYRGDPVAIKAVVSAPGGSRMLSGEEVSLFLFALMLDRGLDGLVTSHGERRLLFCCARRRSQTLLRKAADVTQRARATQTNCLGVYCPYQSQRHHVLECHQYALSR
jgi:hypothetical protein